ncbi:DUF5689 domain-containing protein [Kaistella sp. BT6-1-3]|uniref:DUF5689 domain-containing protein n=1 Tax=Kaistella yananensis TaxID=2989820 RepID=A0ABT3JN20_9FLAO|nr:DUF5689 domain-containing protein [Kaistella yananensis]MCW4451850.1 DUF5689 domain-containing protein [Kaistella yananensis]
MKKYFSLIKLFTLVFSAFLFNSCVHDDEYDALNADNLLVCTGAAYYENPANGFEKWTLQEVKAKPQNQTITDKAYIEGYVSSSDETGNIYKYIYIQDAPENPTQGFTISVNSLSNYANYPQGSKIYIEVKDLAVGAYGGVTQLGAMVNGAFDRIPEKMVTEHIKRSCDPLQQIVPKVMTLAQMVSAYDQYLGCLIQVDNAEFDSKVLCSTFAPPSTTVDRAINDPSTSTSRVVRNSGYASFATKTLPAGKGKFVGIYSKFNTTYQMYIVRDTDLEMNTFPRKDGITADPCSFNPANSAQKTVAEVKQMYTSGNYTQITQDAYLKAKVIANDETGNLYKYVYIEDATGGIRVNINKLNLYQDGRFRVGKNLIIKLKDLYIGKSGGEFQLGAPFNGNIGQVEEKDVYKFFIDSKENITPVTATEKTIPQLSFEDVGKWIKIKNVQYVESDLGEPYAAGTTTNRTLKDCSGNEILLRTSNFATFANNTIDAGQGDVYAVLSYYNGTYQLWIPYQVNADFDNERCDGAVAPTILFSDEFGTTLNATNWTAVSVTGAQVWKTSNQGTGSNYYAVMNGFANGSNENEDWLISKEIDLNGYSQINLTFDSDVRYSGTPLKAFVTDNYTGSPATTSWTELSPVWDTNSGAFGFVNSGNVSLNSFAGKKVRIAFKYVSTTSAANTWEIDNVKVKAKP